MSEQPTYPTIADWIAQEAIPFSLDASESFNAAVDQFIRAADPIEVLGLGEALHGGEDILIFRNRLFQYLVEAHEFSAVAIESSFHKTQLINEYVAGRGPATYEAVKDAGFSHGFGPIEATRELVEWMRQYNADPAHRVKLNFYGFDSPTEMTGTDSPRPLLTFVLDYLASLDPALSQAYRQRVDALIGDDAQWENPAAMMDPSQAIGSSPAATALRIETEELISELHVRRPEWIARGGEDRYQEAVHYASIARQLLTYHAGLAQASDDRIAKLLGVRDALMASNLEYIISREKSRGKVLVFAHNSHLQRGKTEWQLEPHHLVWWPVGAHLETIYGSGYVVIGSAVGVSEENGIGAPETGTLEAFLTGTTGPLHLLPTHRGQHFPADQIASLPTRSRSQKNSMYFPLTAQSLTDFDWLVSLDSTTYQRGGPPLPGS